MQVSDVEQVVSMGAPPRGEEIDDLVAVALERYRDQTAGRVADYITGPCRPTLSGVVVAEVDGGTHAAGVVEFSIQSIAKAFVYALVCEEGGHEVVRGRVGVNNTGLAFNSVVAIPTTSRAHWD